MTKQIELVNGKGIAIVDDSDYEVVCKHRWILHNKGYASTKVNAKVLLMHTLIMSPPEGYEVDHIDGNRLNNQRSNLRNCTHGHNQRNRKKSSHSKQLYKGISQRSERSWQARIRVNNECIYLGSFSSPQEAAEMYDKAAKQYHGEFAKLNFPNYSE